MSNRILFLVSFFALLIMQPSIAAAELKVGYFNFGQILQNVPQTREAEKKLEAEFEPKKKEISDLQEKIKKMATDYEKNKLVMSENDLVKIQSDLRAQEREYKLLVQDYQDDLSIRRNQEMSTIQKLIYQEALEIAKAGTYDLLLQNGVIYASAKVDITAQILKSLSEK